MTAPARAFAEPLVAAFELIERPMPADPEQVVRELDALKALLREVRHVEHRAERRRLDAVHRWTEGRAFRSPAGWVAEAHLEDARSGWLGSAIDASRRPVPSDPAALERGYRILRRGVARLWRDRTAADGVVADAIAAHKRSALKPIL